MQYSVEFIWQKFKVKLKAFILSKVIDDATADDILQEVFIKIHTHIDTLKDETKLQSWLYQITRNLISDHFRAANTKLPDIQELIQEPDDPNAEEVMSEALEDMAKTMAYLPSEYCEALCQTELGGMSQKDYAKKIGISYSGAKSRVQRARSMLRDMLPLPIRQVWNGDWNLSR